ncbi:MAG TPA: hypothetical protein VF608_09975 [Thermoanaerobaculia bacterium]
MIATRVWNALSPVANIWTFAALFIVAVLFTRFGFKPQGLHYPEHTLDGRHFGFWPADVHGILERFDKAKQLDTYLEQEWKLDLVFPLIYCGMLAVGIVAVGNRVHAPHWLIWLPLVTAIADYVENFNAIWLIRTYQATQTTPDALAKLAAIASRVKWDGLWLSAIALVWLLACWGIRAMSPTTP